jgi:hypothetical protein
MMYTQGFLLLAANLQEVYERGAYNGHHAAKFVVTDRMAKAQRTARRACAIRWWQ